MITMKKHIQMMKKFVILLLLFLLACSNEEGEEYSGVVEDQIQTIYSQTDGVFVDYEVLEHDQVEEDEILGKIDDELHGYQTKEAKAAVKAIEAEINQLENDGAGEDDLKVIHQQLKQSQARLDQAKYLQSQTVIKAPNNGTISEWLVRKGDMVTAGTPLATLILDEAMELTVYIPQHKLSNVDLGDIVNVKAVAFPNKTYKGEIVYIADEAIFNPQNMETTEDKAKKIFPIKNE